MRSADAGRRAGPAGGSPWTVGAGGPGGERTVVAGTPRPRGRSRRADLVASGPEGVPQGCRSPSRTTWSGSLSTGAGTVSAISSGTFADLPISSATRTDSSDGKTSPGESLAGAHVACFAIAFAIALGRRLSARTFPRNECPTVPPGNTFRTSPSWCIAQTVMDCSLGIGPRGVHRESVPRRNIGALVRAPARRGPGLGDRRRRASRAAVGPGAVVVAGAASSG